jgi:hypothetical protein
VLLPGSAADRADAKSDYLAAFRGEYPAAVGSRIDTCSLCHSAIPQLNPYGSAFSGAGREFASIGPLDSDGDDVINLVEISALTFPGDPADLPALPTPTPTETLLPATPTATLPTAPPATPSATPGSGTCAGDCNANGMVNVDELVRAVNIALGIADVDVCTPVDGDDNGAVSISELLRAVNASLNGCA